MPPELVFLEVVRMIGVLGAFAIAAGVVVKLAGMRQPKKTASLGMAGGSLERIEEKLAQLEQSSQAMAVEIERIAEGQRFVTKLLANDERGTRRIAPPGQ